MSMPRQNIVKVDLASRLQRIERGALLATADKLANRMGAEVYQNGKAASLTGYTVKGYFIRAGVDTITIAGTISGNQAYVELPESCYYHDGSFSLAVKLCKSGYEQTLVIFDGYIAQTVTGSMIDTTKAVPYIALYEALASEQNYVKLETKSSGANNFTGYVTGDTKQIIIRIPLRINMVSKPTVKFTGGIVLRGTGGYSSDASHSAPYTSPAVSCFSGHVGYCAGLSIEKPDGTAWAGLTNNTPVNVVFTVGSVLELTAK